MKSRSHADCSDGDVDRDEKVSVGSGRWVDVINPATEPVEAQGPDADAQDVDREVKVACQAFDEGPWWRLMPNERGRLLCKLAELMEKHGEELALLDTQGMGFELSEAYTQLNNVTINLNPTPEPWADN